MLVNKVSLDIINKNNHILVAGASGSGKSVLINNLIYTIISHHPDKKKLILLDPKRVELRQYKECRHCLDYADNFPDMVAILEKVIDTIEYRYKIMQAREWKKWQGSTIYVVIDELADLILTNKKVILPLLQKIGQISRAAGIKTIVGTQCPTVQVLPTVLKVNYDCIIGLRTRSAQDSRNILGCNGCENLPRYGKAIMTNPDYLDPVKFQVDMILESDIIKMINYYR